MAKMYIEFGRIMHMLSGNYNNSVALIGSRRYMTIFQSACQTLSMNGISVQLPAIFSFPAPTCDNFYEAEHEILDSLHFKKIRDSYAVLVVNGDETCASYIGENTAIELQYARKMDKPIFYTKDNGIQNVIKYLYEKIENSPCINEETSSESSDSPICSIMKYLSNEQKTEIAEEIYRAKCNELINDLMQKRSAPFNGDIPGMVLDKSIDFAGTRILEDYRNEMMDLINTAMEDKEHTIVNGLEYAIIDRAREIIKDNKSIDDFINSNIEIVLQKLVNGVFTSNLTGALRKPIEETIHNVIISMNGEQK